MPSWTYNQRKGQLRRPDGRLDRDRGYSGIPEFRNNPDAEGRSFQGPIPRGSYVIGRETESKGPVTLEINADGHDARGRNEFRIHGDSRRNPGQASEGCIILNRRQREAIRDSRDRRIDVVDEQEWER